jgi:hypothetical protein
LVGAQQGTAFGLGGLNGLGSIQNASPQLRAMNETVFRLSGGANIASSQPARTLPGAPGFLGGLAGIAESAGRDPMSGEFNGPLGPVAGMLRQASTATTLNLLGIV